MTAAGARAPQWHKRTLIGCLSALGLSLHQDWVLDGKLYKDPCGGSRRCVTKPEVKVDSGFHQLCLLRALEWVRSLLQ